MNAYQDRDMQAQDSLLDSVERAIRAKTQTGRANEARYGFVARMANATPPVNERFRRTLRARILAELTKEGKQTMTTQDRTRPVNLWRFVLVTLTAILIVTLVLTYSRTQVMELDGVPVDRLRPSLGLSREDYDAFDALAEALNEAPAPRTVVVFPDYAGPVAERVRHEVVPLLLNDDLAPATIQAALGTILPPSGFVDMIMVGQEATDPTRQVRAALEQALYRLYSSSGQSETETFGGALERSTFLVGPRDVVLEPIGAVFDGGIELVAGGVLDDPQPGTPLRLAFDWRITEPVNDSLVMFVHLVCKSQLVAQRDAVPGNGLFPVESWEPGEVVRDQFALRLPLVLPAGVYEIQVGIYSSASGQRYNLTKPQEGTYVVVQQFTVKATSQTY